MLCPRCHTQHPADTLTCPHCELEVSTRSPSEDDGELVTVLVTQNVALLPVLKSVLDGAEIPYVIPGDDLLGVFPFELRGGLFGSAQGGAIKIQVPRRYAEEARWLLESESGQLSDG